MAIDDYPTQSGLSQSPVPREHRQSGVVGLVLSGGAGRRMQGKDKGLLELDGRSGVSLALERLEPHCKGCFISANRNIEAYQSLPSLGVVRDLRSDYQGPLAGIESVGSLLRPEAGDEYLLILPCDLPHLDAEVPKQLLAALRTQPICDIVYATTTIRAHYLCAALRVKVLGSLSAQLDHGHRAVRDWYASRESAPLQFHGELAAGFVNVNRPEDLGP